MKTVDGDRICQTENGSYFSEKEENHETFHKRCSNSVDDDGPLSAADINLYNGIWINPSYAPQAVTKIEISVVDPKIRVHAFGQLCPKTDYDWGWESASSHDDSQLSARYRNTACLRDLTMTLTGNRLVVKTHTHYSDGSGRSNREVLGLRRMVLRRSQLFAQRYHFDRPKRCKGELGNERKTKRESQIITC